MVALALKAAPKGETDADVHALPFYSPPDGLPELPATSWATWAAAPPARSPHMMLLASPPRDGAFALESWLGRLDSTLPWARKVGGLLAGDGRLFEGSNEHNGGAVGLAIAGVQMDALCCQGALPVGPSFEITSSEANIIRELDGRDVAEAVHDILAQFSEPPRAGNQVVMAGISVPTRPAAAVPPPAADDDHASTAAAAASASSSKYAYVVRSIVGYSRAQSALLVGASPELLQAPGARLQLHAFSAANARSEVQAAAAALASRQTGGYAGGLMVACVGRGAALYGEEGVESAELERAIGKPLALTGFFAGGEIGPVGSRTFVHTYTTTVGLLREQA